jgi:hypothetical protein
MKKGKILFIVIIGVTTMFLISSFLSGKIIEIPHQGTHKGGMFAMTGIGIILIVMFVMGLVFRLLNKKSTRNKNDI